MGTGLLCGRALQPHVLLLSPMIVYCAINYSYLFGLFLNTILFRFWFLSIIILADNEGEDIPIGALSAEDSAAADMKRKTKAKHHHLQRNQRTCNTTGSSELKESVLHTNKNNPRKIMLEQIHMDAKLQGHSK